MKPWCPYISWLCTCNLCSKPYINKVEWNPGARTSRVVIFSQNGNVLWWGRFVKEQFLRGNFVIGSFVKVYASKANVLCWDDVLCEERCEGPFSKIISSVCIFLFFVFYYKYCLFLCTSIMIYPLFSVLWSGGRRDLNWGLYVYVSPPPPPRRRGWMNPGPQRSNPQTILRGIYRPIGHFICLVPLYTWICARGHATHNIFLIYIQYCSGLS